MSSSDRLPYENATTLTQQVLDFCQDNLTNRLEPIVEIQAPDGSIIRASDRNKYVGPHFYEALTTFPTISRTVGDWLGGGLTFPELQIELSNVDGRFNRFLPGGADFAGWVGRVIEVKVGLREVASTYFTIFRGRVSEVGGFGRTVKSLIIRARDELEKVNASFPTALFSDTTYPKADDQLWGTAIPIVYGDWTTGISPGAASVPAIVINGLDPYVSGEPVNVAVTPGSPATFVAQNHRLDEGDKVTLENDGTYPSGLAPGDYFVRTPSPNAFGLSLTAGGTLVSAGDAGTGTTSVRKPELSAFENISFVIAAHPLLLLQTQHVYLKRGSTLYRIPAGQVVNVEGGNSTFEVVHGSPLFLIDGENYVYTSGDEFFVRVKGKNLGAYSDNIVWMARDLLLTYGGLISSDFDSTWTTFRDKASPAPSAISAIRARVWRQEQGGVMEFALSLLEQVRLEIFVNRALKFSLNSLHLDDWETAPGFTVRNWDVEKESFAPSIDERNNFNRAQAAYGFLPILGENGFLTPYLRNSAAISQAGREISRTVVFPNLYIESDVLSQLTEVLRLASAFREVVSITLTSRAILQEIGDFVLLNVMIGSSQFENVPAMIRELTYEPGNLKLPMKMWSMAMIPFPGWAPGYAGTVGGASATITEEP
jgi:hypothetical protein